MDGANGVGRLAGVAIAQQVLVLDAGANAAGAVVSSASRLTVSIR